MRRPRARGDHDELRIAPAMEAEAVPTFTAAVGLRETIAAGVVVRQLAEIRATSAEAIVSSAVEPDRVRSLAFDRLTPLRKRPGAADAEKAFGWTLLWMACACETPSEPLLGDARDFLARLSPAYLGEMKEALRTTLGLPGIVVSSDIEDDDL